MVTINLLPWREHKRAYEAAWAKKLLMISCCLSLLAVFFVHLYLNERMTKRQKQVVLLQEEVAAILAEQRFMQNQQGGAEREDTFKQSHELMQHLLAEMGKQPNANLCFTEIFREKNTIIFSGNAQTAADLTVFLTHWSAASLFSEIKIERLQYQSASQQMQFRFQALLK